VSVPDDDSSWPFQDTGSHTPEKRKTFAWLWLIGMVAILLLLCGGAFLAFNSWLGDRAEQAKAQSAKTQSAKAQSEKAQDASRA
jgi:cytochrome c-type biogenesis protein CcmH/NrfG